MTEIVKYFTDLELNCRCGCGNTIDPNFASMLSKLRGEFGAPLIVTSGRRCERHNKTCGGAAASQHLTGMAVDIDWSKMDGGRRLQLLSLAYAHGFTGVGIGSTILHLDVRTCPTRVMWIYKDR